MRYGSLSDVRVIDLTHFIAGPYATKLLATLGAQVIKVEPPWGEPGRRLGPFPPGSSGHGAHGGLFAFLNTDKLGITLNLKREPGRAALLGLLEGADLLVENFAPGTLARLGFAPQQLLGRFPRLSIVSISNFGQTGPERDGILNDLTLFARGGWTFPVGEPDREPLTPPGSLAQFVGGVYGAIGAMEALLARDFALGRGQHVDLSLLEATVSTMIYESVAFQYTGIVRTRVGKRFNQPNLIVTLKTRDGYAGLHCVTEKQFRSLLEIIGRPDLLHDPRFEAVMPRIQNLPALIEILEQFFLTRDRKWLAAEGLRRGLPLVPIPSAAEVLEWEQTRARNYFETIDDPALGQIRIPGPPLRLGSHRGAPSRPAPRLGEHNREILGVRLGLGEAKLRELQGSGAEAEARP